MFRVNMFFFLYIYIFNQKNALKWQNIYISNKCCSIYKNKTHYPFYKNIEQHNGCQYWSIKLQLINIYDHKTSLKCHFFEIEIYASSESWINNIYIEVWFVMIGQYL